MDFKSTITMVFRWMPIIYGIGFLAPLFAAFITLSGVDVPFGRTPLDLGLALGLGWGVVAKLTGRWI